MSTTTQPRPTILLVEDNVLIAMATAQKITDFGYEVVTAHSGEQAVNMATENQTISLILMDINLGRGIDGTEAARQILATRQIPIVFLTSHTEEEYVSRVKAITRYGYIIKGSGDFVLKSSINMAFELFQEHEQTRKSEAFLHATGRMARVGGWELDAITHAVSWTEETYRIHELPLEYQPPLEDAINFFHPDDRERLRHAIRRALEHGDPYDLELRFITATGKQLWVRTMCEPILHAGTVVKLHGTFQDIDEYKQAQKVIQEQNEEIQVQNEELRVTNEELLQTYESLQKRVKELKCLQELTRLVEASEHLDDVFGGLLYALQDAWESPEQTAVRIVHAGAVFQTDNFCETPWKQSVEIMTNGEMTGTIDIVPLSKREEENDNPFLNEERVVLEMIAKRLGRFLERQHTEKALKHSRKMLARTERIAHVGSWEWEIASDTVIWSEELYRIFGRDPAGQPPTWAEHAQLYDPDDMARLQHAVAQSISTGAPYKVELRARHLDGSARMCLAQGFPETDAHGRVVRLYGSLHDITARKAAEEELRFQAMLLNQIQDLITATDVDGTVQFINESNARMLGVSQEHIIGRTVFDFGEDASKGATQQEILETTLQHGKWRGEVVNYDRDGNEYILDCRTWIIRDEHGEPQALCSVSTDITERKKAEEALQESERKYRKLVDTIPGIIFQSRIDPDGTRAFIFISENIADYCPYSAREILERPESFLDTIHPEDRPAFEAAVAESALTLKPFQCVHRIRSTSGEYIWLNNQSIPEKKPDGRIEWVGVAIDITAQKNAEHALQAANTTKDAFLSLIAHDLKNPLLALQSGTELLSAHFQDSDDRPAREIFGELYRRSRQVYALLEQLLTWARMQRGTFPYHPAPLSLHAVSHDIVALVRDQVARKHLAIDCRVPEAMQVDADKNMVETVLRNLLTNAVKFTDEGGTITVAAQDAGDMIEVSVSDTGAGMPEEKRQRLFRAGERHISSVGTAGETGTGLGLVLCKEFIDRHGGEIWITSIEGQGSTVTFTLPKICS